MVVSRTVADVTEVAVTGIGAPWTVTVVVVVRVYEVAGLGR